jgi:transcriptional regulator with XRE-family HTH domain
MGKEGSRLGKVVGVNLTKWMAARKMNDRDVERVCGVGHKTVNNMRHHRHEPELDNIEKVASALRVPPWMLLVPELDDVVFSDEALRSLIEDYVHSKPNSRLHIAGMARDAAIAATQRKAS